MDKEEAIRFLWGQGIRLVEWKVRKLVEALPEILAGEKSLRSFYYNPKASSFMGKGSAYKIKDLFERGNLDPYLHHLDSERDWHPALGEKNFGAEIRGLIYRWLAETTDDSLKEVLKVLWRRVLLPEALMSAANGLVLVSLTECEIKDWREIKHLILRTYLNQWRIVFPS